MNTFVLRILFYLALFYFISCNKNEGSKEDDHSASCTGSKADVETINIFPPDNPWNEDISSSPIDTNSDQIISNLSTSTLKADFGSGLWNNAPIGIPFVVVCGSQAKIAVTFTDYGDESDPGPYAIPMDAPIEGNGNGDAHVISVDKENGIYMKCSMLM